VESTEIFFSHGRCLPNKGKVKAGLILCSVIQKAMLLMRMVERITDGGEVVILTCLPPSTPQKHSLFLSLVPILLEAE
jgi:hypothetical protein